MTPIYRRPLDLALIAFFSITVLYGLLFSLPEGLGIPVSADSPWPPLRPLHEWAVAEEPAHLDPPPNLAYYLAFNLPWLIAPLVLGLRVLLAKDLARPGVSS
jgi:hypothetical protein